MLRTTAGQLAVNSGLPEELRDYARVLDKKGIEKLLRTVAEKHPDKYREIVQHLSKVGYHMAQMTGGNSFGGEHMRLSVAGRKSQIDLKDQIRKINMDQTLDGDAKDKAVVDLLIAAGEPLTQAVMKETLSEDNPLGMQVLSGARGNPTNLRALRAGDLLYVDHRNRPIPIPILRSYSQGLSPAEYYAGTFGARKGVIDTKFAVQDAGFASKQFNQAAHRLIVTGLDKDGEHDSSIVRGLPVETEDPDNEGALLATDTGPYKRNTVLTPKILSELKGQGFERLVVRSPLVGGHPNGGVYARDVGVREKGGLAPTGDFVGIAAAQALSEPLTQSMLSSKHSGGVAGAAKAVGGFELINNLFQVPRVFKGGASHAQVDGKVTGVREASQGGHYVAVNGKDHYVGQGYDVKVKPGDEIEAGDLLSEGIPNPQEIVRHKGLGEGMRYFTKTFRQAYKDSGIGAHRRNIELLARGLINHVEMEEEHGEHVPGDLVPYHAIEHAWEPREGHKVMQVKDSKGMYLEQPVLHYTIGTKMKPSVLRTLDEFGIQNVSVHKDPPPFRPVMIRGMENLAHDPDWMTRFLGSYLKKNVLKAVHRGAVSDEAGTSYVPSLARAVDFGKQDNPVHGFTPVGPFAPPPKPNESIMQQMNTPEVKHASLMEKLSGKQQDRARVVMPHGGKYLLERLSNPKYPERVGMTRFPGGGVEEGETPQQAAVRELMEELGLHVTPEALQPLGTVKHPEWGHNEHYFWLGDHGLQPGTFKATAGGDAEIHLEPGEPGQQGFFGTNPAHLIGTKKASDDVLNQFTCEYPAGTHRQLFDNDEDYEDYPLRSIRYPANYGSLLGFKGEDDDALDMFKGDDKRGHHGSFVVRRPESFKTETKFYAHLTPKEKDQVLRAFMPVLESHTEHKTPAELLEALERFRSS